MLEYARWKYILIVAVLVVALLYALPNVFGSAPALQLAHRDHSPVTAAEASSIAGYLRQHGVHLERAYVDSSGRLMVQFPDVSDQLQGRDAADAKYQGAYISALSLVPRAPAFFRALGLKPMPLGLDLRGGLDLLYQVDVNSAVAQMLQNYSQDSARALAAKKIPVRSITFSATGNSQIQNAIQIAFPPGTDLAPAQEALTAPLQGLTITKQSTSSGPVLVAAMTPADVKQREDYAIEQSVTILRNRVNQLGVSEPIVQRQGLDRIDVQLPGIQNSAEVKNLLGQVATLEFRLQDESANAIEAAQTGNVPLGDKLYTNTAMGVPLLLKRELIATGDQLTNATVGQGQQGPAVDVTLNSKAGDNMLRTTRQNLGKHMAVVLIEKHQQTSTVDGKKVTREVTTEKVINDATIQGVFADRFEITGLSMGEARDLAVLLRSGSLPTPIFLVAEQVIGPSLGKDNIRMGIDALVIGMAGVLAFMAIYYKVFGLVADLVLIANVVLLTALLSMMNASLSLPGIAGIILTVGIAVDANVLIYERIREEIRKGVTPQAAIRAGFEKAFSAIADSNITTLIAGLVLWVFGTGAIRGFAIVLTLGIATSMFTSLMGSRALVTLMYGRKRKVARLPI
ncbi:MAG TPA: protein translocase subunit SecD [Steroidobacteraceae bacterium]|jgi:preprotein translocase subunit SecD|nr:protein translocase subunit SecD [Steroidobacteraceae bacterium]